MSIDLIRALHHRECHEDVIRLGEHAPCERPAVAVRLDPECGEPYPVCTTHARTPELMVPLADLEAALRESIASQIEAAKSAVDQSIAAPGHYAGLGHAARIARGGVA